MIKDYFELGIKNLKKRKLRSWLTVVGIFISVSTIFVLVSLSLGLQNAVNEEFRLFGTDKFFIEPAGQLAGPGSGGAVQLTIDDVNTVVKVQGVKDYSYATIGNAEIEFKGEKRFVMVIGFPLDKSAVLTESGSYKAASGKLLQKGDVGKIMVGSLYSKGSVFSQDVEQGNTININGVDFKVKTVLEPIGSPTDDKMIYMPIDDFKSLFNNTNRIDEIIVQVNPGANVKDVAALAEKRLLSERGLTEDTKDFTILTPEELLASIGVVLNIITAFLVGVALISLLVGAIGIANTMYTSVLERTSEIGVMKAIGARNSDILYIFLIESGLLGLVGGILGVLLGFGASKVVQFIANAALGTNLLQTAAPWYLFVGCLAFAFLIGAVSGVLPAWGASKVRPVEALRYE